MRTTRLFRGPVLKFYASFIMMCLAVLAFPACDRHRTKSSDEDKSESVTMRSGPLHIRVILDEVTVYVFQKLHDQASETLESIDIERLIAETAEPEVPVVLAYYQYGLVVPIVDELILQDSNVEALVEVIILPDTSDVMRLRDPLGATGQPRWQKAAERFANEYNRTKVDLLRKRHVIK